VWCAIGTIIGSKRFRAGVGFLRTGALTRVIPKFSETFMLLLSKIGQSEGQSLQTFDLH
jgi:hypothetical protein